MTAEKAHRPCALVGLGCPTPSESVDGRHITANYEVYSEYHPWCHDDPDCLFDEEHHTPPGSSTDRDEAP